MTGKKFVAALLAALLLVCLFGFGTALAGTTTSLTGSNVANSSGIGGTNITFDGLNTSQVTVTLTGGKGGIINWSSLGVDSGEILRFNFSNTPSSAAVLNRVTGTDSSQIAGQINSNGKVFLVNPNGIVFTSGAAIINAPLFVASTLPVTDAAFSNYVTGGNSLLFGPGVGSIQVTDPIAVDAYPLNAALIASTVTVAPGVSLTAGINQVSAGAGSVTFTDSGITINPYTPGPIVQAMQATTGTIIAGTPGMSGGVVGLLPGQYGFVPASNSFPPPIVIFSPPPPPPPPSAQLTPEQIQRLGQPSASDTQPPPPPVQGLPQSQPRPPQSTTQLTSGLSQMVTAGNPPGGGVPGISTGFSSSGTPGRW